ncbi:uncharacterized protein LTR77_004856 [Saxophila tyrrhenica]|uniref:Uncharacterized protein n=1 Tax=Saxophila tyrrhenica TaxID=1690608 RepID=A0AAV9PDG1_9PEZI|nr:hypothetical protein LTR77_004856 [Saxophila tyrrhenica]
MSEKSLLVGPAALLVWGSVDKTQVAEAALNAWWTNEHLPERLSIPGFQRARRYICQNDPQQSTKYLTFYEVSKLDVLTSEAYMDKLNNPTAGTKQHIPTLATMQRAACRLVYSETRSELRSIRSGGGCALAMSVVSLPPDDQAGNKLPAELSPAFKEMESDRSVMALHLFREDVAATAPGSQSQSYIYGNLQQNQRVETVKWIVLVEFSQPGGSQTALRPIIDILSRLTDERVAAFDMYDFMCSAE